MSIPCCLPATVLLMTFCASQDAVADLELPPIFADHMVLQNEEPILIWGEADAGATVAVEFAGARISSRADDHGRWRITFAEMKASAQSRSLIIESGDERIVIDDVLIGEVWVCSGQSNMEWSINASADARRFKAEASDPRIRMFTVPKTATHDPQGRTPGSWAVASPDTVGRFSAVGYHFGRNLLDQLDVPIGLIHSSWGGSTIEAWISRPKLDALPAAAPFTAAYDRAIEARGMSTDRFTGTQFEADGWEVIALPTLVENAGHNVDGIMWFRRSIIIPPDWNGRELTLSLGPIDDNDVTYFNGKRIGGINNYQQPRMYTVPAELVRAGRAVIAIRVEDTGGAGGFNGAPDAMTIAPSDGAGEPIGLAGHWYWQLIADAQSGPVQHRPANLYNAMIHGLRDYAIRGTIWYQGESNALGDRGEEYFTLFPGLIEDWRQAFGSLDMPFLFVQLPDFTNNEPNTPWRYPVLRQAQLETHRRIANTGMAVTLDLGAANDIHPRNKHDVGDRLARWALADVYDEPVAVKSGPLPRRVDFDADRGVVVQFDTFGSSLASRDGEAVRGFEVAGADGKWLPASARIEGDNTVLVFSGDAPRPQQVRYAWLNNTAACNLGNAAGLPASPFRFQR